MSTHDEPRSQPFTAPVTNSETASTHAVAEVFRDATEDIRELVGSIPQDPRQELARRRNTAGE